MAVLVFRFGLAGAILSDWALASRVTWPTGRTLAHVLVSGLLTAPAVLGAVIISMNPVVTAVLATTFLGVLAVLAACAGRLFAVIPAVAGLLSWLMLGQRPDIGIAIGLVVGAAACPLASWGPG